MTQLQRFQKSLANAEFDCAIISSEINQRYLCDFSFSDGYIIVSPDSAYLFTDSRYIEAARKSVKGFEIPEPDAKKKMSDTITDHIKDKNYKSIAFEEASMSFDVFETLKKKFPEDCKLSSGASKLLSKQRAVKLPYEISRIEKAQIITDAAFEHILTFISPDVTEMEIALELEFFMRKNGAEATAFDTIAISGSSSSLPHGVPSREKIKKGFLTMDFGAKYMGYCSDMTRTVIVGKADAEMKKVYNTVLAAQRNALENIKGGMLCSDADELARGIIRNAGYDKNFGHSLGHGVGMYIHEKPSLSQYAEKGSILEAGNVVTVEPGIYLEGRFGCRIEDMIAINEDGSTYNFTQSKKELIELL